MVLLAIVLSLVLHDIMYGPQAALISETFGTGVRYSGAGLGYQLASVIAGGPAPLIATAILAEHESSAGISWYIVGCAVVSIRAAGDAQAARRRPRRSTGKFLTQGAPGAPPPRRSPFDTRVERGTTRAVRLSLRSTTKTGICRSVRFS